MSDGVRPARPHEWQKLGLSRPPSDARFTPDTSSQDTDDIRMDYLRADELDAHFCNCAGQFVTVLQPDREAAAALLLQRAGPDGKPLFTREHLKELREEIEDRESDAGSYTSGPTSTAILKDLADRLESLLPPEEP